MSMKLLPARAASRLSCFAIVFLATVASVDCGDTNSGQDPEHTAKQQSALAPRWIHVGPTGGVSQGNNAFFTGTTTDAEGVNGRYRISTLGDGIFEWNGSSWVSLSSSISPVNSPPLNCEGLAVNTFATRPGDPNTIVAGTAGQPQHGGSSSSRPSGGLQGGSVASGIWRGVWNQSIVSWQWTQVVMPTQVGDVFKLRWSDANTVHASTRTGYWVSRDIGVTWSEVLAQYTTDLAIAPGNSTWVYLASDGIGVQKVTWTLNGNVWGHAERTVVSNAAASRSVLATSQAPGQPLTVYYMPGNFGAGVRQGKVSHGFSRMIADFFVRKAVQD